MGLLHEELMRVYVEEETLAPIVTVFAALKASQAVLFVDNIGFDLYLEYCKLSLLLLQGKLDSALDARVLACRYAGHSTYLAASPAWQTAYCSSSEKTRFQAQTACRNKQCGQRDLYAGPFVDDDGGQDCVMVEE